MNQTINIGADEWETVSVVVDALAPVASPRFPGVVLHGAAGPRRWSVTTPWLQVSIPGDGCGVDRDEVRLPAELVAAGAELAAMAQECELAVEFDTATVANQFGAVTCGVWRPVATTDLRADGSGGATAEVAIDWLLRELRRAEGGDTWLTIEDDAVVVSVERSRFEPEQCEARVPGRTYGRASARVPGRALVLLLAALEEEGSACLAFDMRRKLLFIDGFHWSAVAALGRRRVPGHAGELGLGALELDLRSGSSEVEIDGVQVVLTALPDRGVGARVRLTDGVEPTPELLGELNALNASSLGARLWCQGREVWAGVDVAERGLEDLADGVRGLVAAVADLGPIIGVIGGADADDRHIREQLPLPDGDGA